MTLRQNLELWRAFFLRSLCRFMDIYSHWMSEIMISLENVSDTESENMCADLFSELWLSEGVDFDTNCKIPRIHRLLELWVTIAAAAPTPPTALTDRPKPAGQTVITTLTAACSRPLSPDAISHLVSPLPELKSLLHLPHSVKTLQIQPTDTKEYCFVLSCSSTWTLVFWTC